MNSKMEIKSNENKIYWAEVEVNGEKAQTRFRGTEAEARNDGEYQIEMLRLAQKN